MKIQNRFHGPATWIWWLSYIASMAPSDFHRQFSSVHDLMPFQCRYHGGFTKRESHKLDFSIEILSIITHRLKFYSNILLNSFGAWIKIRNGNNNNKKNENKKNGKRLCLPKICKQTIIWMSYRLSSTVKSTTIDAKNTFHSNAHSACSQIVFFFSAVSTQLPAHVRDLTIRYIWSTARKKNFAYFSERNRET